MLPLFRLLLYNHTLRSVDAIAPIAKAVKNGTSQSVIVNCHVVIRGLDSYFILVGAVSRIFPITILIALLTLPLAVKARGLISGNLGNPYGLMPAMSSNIKIFAYTAILMLAGYLISFLI